MNYPRMCLLLSVYDYYLGRNSEVAARIMRMMFREVRQALEVRPAAPVSQEA